MLRLYKKIVNHPDGKKIVNNIVSLGLLRGLDFLIPLITIPYLVHTVGLENYGFLAFSMSMAMYSGAIVQYGFNITAVREISKARNNKYNISKIYSTTITTSCCLAFICLLLTTAAINMIPLKGDQFIYFASVYYVLMLSILPTWLFQGIEKMQYIAIFNILMKLIYLSSLFLLITTPEDYIFVHFINGCTMTISFFSSILIIRFRLKVVYKLPSIQELSQVLKNGFSAFLSQLAPNLYNNSATFLLGLFGSGAVVGAFSAASTIVESVILIGRIFSSAVFPYLSRSIKNHYIIERLMLCAGFILTIITILFSGNMAEILFKNNSDSISEIILGLAPSIFFAYAYLTYSTNYLMVVGLDRKAATIAILCSITFLLISLITIPIWYATAAIYVMVLARASMATCSFLVYRNTKKLYL